MRMHTPRKCSMKEGGSIIPLLTSILQRDTVKVLTLYDPWAELVAIGAKKLETRSWPTGYRGPLAIHVSTRFSAEDELLCSQEPFHSALLAGGFQPRQLAGRKRRNAWGFPLGCVVAVAWLEDVCQLPLQVAPEHLPPEPERAFGNFGPGRFIWSLPLVYRLPQPLKAMGSYGLWDWQPPDHFWVDVQARLDVERQQEEA